MRRVCASVANCIPGSRAEAVPPSVQAVSPIGSGDALAAAYTWAMTRKTQPRAGAADALRWGVAAGTASALLPGMQFATLAQTRHIYKQVESGSAD